MVRSQRIAIVIPAYNEEMTISKIVKEVNKYGQSIVIDDGSKDKTAHEAEKCGAIVERHRINLGYDNALNTGFKIAAKINCDYIITFDADGQHEPELLRSFIDALNIGYSIVLGVRNKKARIAEYLFGLYTKHRYGIIDPLCGLKAYKTENYKSIGYFDSYNSIGTELMLKNITAGKEFKQIFFKIKKRSDRTRFGNSILANFKIFRSLFFCILKM